MSMYTFRLIGFIFFLAISSFSFAQEFEYPRPSPISSVMQKVGITEVSIKYSSPRVKGRTIWGELVPYDKVWRTGANAATEISFSTDVNLNGKDLKAGTYSLFTLPGKSEWKVMFNSRTDISGTDYKSEADVLTLNVKPQTGTFRERMTFLIENNTNETADIVLHWKKLRLVINLTVNTNEMVMKAAEKEVNKSWVFSFQAASYCLSNDVELEKGLEYARLSTSIQENYWNLRTKAQLEAKLGKNDLSVKTMSEAVKLGEKMENAPFDFDRMKTLLAKWKEKM